ncbi:MAG: DUF3810 domain-containing protein [Clostridia bacterium]|nr:DUF3810 domain-containing protein [Clostridia bacterium]
MKKHDITRLVIAVSALALTGLLMLTAKKANAWFFSFYTALSIGIEGTLSKITGIFPFSVFELLCLIGLVALIVNLILAIKRKRIMKWATALFMTVCLLVLGFTFTWGLNHLGPEITERLGMEVGQYTVEQLEETTRFFMTQAGEAASVLPQNEDGTTAFSSFKDLAREASDGYKTLENEGFEVFGGSDAKPKALASGKLFSYTGTTGIFIFLTGESNVNPDAYIASIPFTMCHELAHRKAVAQEEGANFCAFLACSASKNPEFNYSGFYEAFIYCYNSLYKAAPDKALALWDDASPRLYADITAGNRHYRKYDGKVKEAAQSVNDAYLKAYGETQGVQSYGAVTDSLIAWYLAQ